MIGTYTGTDEIICIPKRRRNKFFKTNSTKKKHPSSSGMQSVGSIFIHQRYSQILTRYLCNANTSINPEFNLSVFYTSNNKEEIT